jgi:hypothetical protein
MTHMPTPGGVPDDIWDSGCGRNLPEAARNQEMPPPSALQRGGEVLIVARRSQLRLPAIMISRLRTICPGPSPIPKGHTGPRC